MGSHTARGRCERLGPSCACSPPAPGKSPHNRPGASPASARTSARKDSIRWSIGADLSCLVLQPFHHQREAERDAEIDHVGTNCRFFKLRGDMAPSWISAVAFRQVLY